MTRRASLPGASELFRRTSNPVFGEGASAPAPTTGSGNATEGNGDGGTGAGDTTSGDGQAPRRLARTSPTRRGSGRQKHDAKITVYLSGDELLAMEQARLTLRAEHALAVDRGRIVREAVAVLLADFEQHGEDSVLVARLREGRLDGQEASN